MTNRVDYEIDGDLKRRILERLGRESGHVAINQEKWDFGFCSTCSYPEEGFSVKVDGEIVWPSSQYLWDFGGIDFADREGYVYGSTLTVYGVFNEWLNGSETWAEEDDYDRDIA